MKRALLVAAALAALALLAVAAWTLRPARSAEGREVGLVAAPSVAATPEAPAVAEPPAEEPAAGAEQDAVAALASAGGRTLIRCPSSVMREFSMALPGRCATTGGGATTCAVDDPEGALLLRPAPASLTGSIALPTGPPSSVLRWWTDPTGETHCAEQEPRERHLALRVVDEQGRATPAALTSPAGFEFAGTDEDGLGTWSAWSESPVPLQAVTEAARSDVAWVSAADGPVTLVLHPERPDAPSWGQERARAEREDIAATLAAGGLPDDVVGVLRGWDATLARVADGR